MDQNKSVSPPKSGYGRRPLWQWVVLYVIVGGAVYAAIYYFMGHKAAGGYGYSAKAAPAATTAPAAPADAAAASQQTVSQQAAPQPPASPAMTAWPQRMTPAPTPPMRSAGAYRW
jgi:hypothetical protein